MSGLDLLWLFFVLSSLQPLVQQQILAARRVRLLRKLEKSRGTRAITLIHRREQLSFLGIPFGGFIDIDDSEAVIRAIEMTGSQVPVDLVLHTPGGLVLAAEQIAAALAAHPAQVTVFVPHYAMSGGTLIALAADSMVIAPSAVLGPIDPQLGEYPAASILAAVAQKDANEIDDKTLILADISRKAQGQVRTFAAGLLRRHMPDQQADELATTSRSTPNSRDRSASRCRPSCPGRSASSWASIPSPVAGGRAWNTSPCPTGSPGRPEGTHTRPADRPVPRRLQVIVRRAVR
jgi:ClpP class serine protease